MHLYHGSGYRHSELKPGIHYTGEKVQWDKTESNEWLYATTVMEEAISQGFASVVEKHFKVARFQSIDNQLIFTFDGPVPAKASLAGLTVYLYTLDWDKAMWVRVDNLVNGMANEYKTTAVIPASMIDSCIEVDLKKYLARKTLILKSTASSLNW